MKKIQKVIASTAVFTTLGLGLSQFADDGNLYS